MPCTYTYNGNQYSEAEFRRVLMELPREQIKQFAELQSGNGIQQGTATDSPIDGARLRKLRSEASAIEAPERGVTFRIDDQGRAIVTGPARTKVPSRFRQFAEENGLTLSIRRSSGDYSNANSAMPLEYRQDGALYFGEIGNGVDGPGHLNRDGKTRFSRSQSPWYFSQLARAVENLPAKVDNTNAQNVKAWLLANADKLGVKKDEIQWTGITDWLDAQGKRKVSKEEIGEFLKQGGVQVEEVVLGEPDVDLQERLTKASDKFFEEVRKVQPIDVGTKHPVWDDELYYMLQDGDLAPDDLPENLRPLAANFVQAMRDRDEARRNPPKPNPSTKHASGNLVLPGGTDHREIVLTIPTIEPYNESDTTHYGDTGKGKAIAWARVNTRTDADGRKVLFVEEIQSQRNQHGRKKGFDTEKVVRPRKLNPGDSGYADGYRYSVMDVEIGDETFWNTLQEAEVAANLPGNAEFNSGVPTAPFVSTKDGKPTDAYISLALKRLVAYAVETGHDSIAWTTGDQQADRYDLSKQIDRIDYYGDERLIAYGKDGGRVLDKRVKPNELEEYIGKEAAEKLMQQPLVKVDDPISQGMALRDKRVLKNADLRIGGGWTQTMYGDATGRNAQGKPSMIAQAAAKLGAQVGGSLVSVTKTVTRTKAEADRDGGNFGKWDEPAESSQPGFPITDAMRKSVENGLPLFSQTQSGTQTNHTVSTLKAAIDASQGKGFADRLEGTGNVVFITDAEVDGILGGGERFSKALPDTITVDGVERPTTNSNGQPIHPTEEGVRNFWKWFGYSQVVDDQGRPLVVYHGTGADITEFKKPSAGKKTSHYLDFGFHFGTTEVADTYATIAQYGGRLQSDMSRDGQKGDPVIYPVYLSAQNIADITSGNPLPEDVKGVFLALAEDNGMSSRSKYVQLIDVDPINFLAVLQRKAGRKAIKSVFESAGYDGIKYSFYGDSYVVFKPTQIKSAIGNQGTFDGSNPDIRYSKDGRILAFVKDGKVHFVADNIDQNTDSVPGLLLHEISVHALSLNRSDSEFQAILKDFERMASVPGGRAEAAMKRVPSDTAEHLKTEEGLGYLVEMNPDLPIAQRFIAWLKAKIRQFAGNLKGAERLRFLKSITDLSENDLIWMAGEALKSAPESLRAAKKRDETLKSGSPGAKLPDTITVDGVERPTANSNGKPIHPTEEGVRNFWKWFAGSKAVDAEGRPLVVYHGTAGEFSEFDTTVGGNGESRLGPGAYFTPSEKRATGYGNTVVQAYISLKNPYITGTTKAPDYHYIGPKRSAELKRQSYDGIILLNDREQPIEYVVFSPTQIKSALGNAGTFDGGNPDIRYSKSSPNPTIPAETRFRQQQRIHQDSMNRFNVIQDWLMENGVALERYSDMDVYRAEERMHGRIAARMEDFRSQTMLPLIKRTHKAGFELLQVAGYLQAKHAIERNEQVEKINPQAVDANGDRNGSGMTDAKATQILADYAAMPNFAELVAIANEWRAITDSTRNILLTSGIISKDQSDAWTNAYKDYVPLRGDMASTSGSGKGKSVNAKSERKRAMGHDAREEYILENIIHAHDRAIYLAEKNLVGKHLLKLAMSVQNDKLWTVEKPQKHAVLMPGQTTYAVAYKGNVIASFATMGEAAKFKSGNSSYTVHKVTGDPYVQYMASPKPADNEAIVYVNGEQIRIQLHDDILARAYMNMGQENLTGALALGRDINSWLSRAYTGLNPEFIVVNAQRDLIGGTINLLGEHGAGFAGSTFKNWLPALRDMMAYSTAGKESKWVRAYRASGGSTGAAWLGDIDRIGKDSQQAYDEAVGVIRSAQENSPFKTGGIALRKFIHGLTFWIEHINAAAENGMRLASFRAHVEREAKRLGVSVDDVLHDRMHQASRNKAASIAKNVTVNFNRKGEVGKQMNALYLFWNAALQGTSTANHALFMGEHKYQAWAALAGLTTTALMLAAQFDDDEWDEIPQHEKDRNMLFKVGDSVVKVAVPYGHGAFFGLGNAIVDLGRGKDVTETAYHIASSLISNVLPMNPLGDEPSISTFGIAVAPTFFSMSVAQPMANQNSFGQQIYPESRFEEYKPDFLKMYGRTHGTVFDNIATGMSNITGGTETIPGVIDVSPEMLRFAFTQATGGTGRFFVDTAALGQHLLNETPDIAIKDIPILRKFVREEEQPAYAKNLFWERLNTLEEMQYRRSAAKKAGDQEGMERVGVPKDKGDQVAGLIKKAKDFAKADAEQREDLRQQYEKPIDRYDAQRRLERSAEEDYRQYRIAIDEMIDALQDQ